MQLIMIVCWDLFDGFSILRDSVFGLKGDIMRRSKVKQVLFIIFVVCVYVGFGIWMGRKIWLKPISSFEKNINEYKEEIMREDTLENIKYEIHGGYKTQNGYRIYEYTGWQAQKNKEWEFTIAGILLQAAGNNYLVDVIQEPLEGAARVIGSNLLKTDKYGFRAVFPTLKMEEGMYQVGLLLKTGEVFFTNEVLCVEKELNEVSE